MPGDLPLEIRPDRRMMAQCCVAWICGGRVALPGSPAEVSCCSIPVLRRSGGTGSGPRSFPIWQTTSGWGLRAPAVVSKSWRSLGWRSRPAPAQSIFTWRSARRMSGSTPCRSSTSEVSASWCVPRWPECLVTTWATGMRRSLFSGQRTAAQRSRLWFRRRSMTWSPRACPRRSVCEPWWWAVAPWTTA